MSFTRFLTAGALVSLLLHGAASAWFARDPDEISVAASAGGGVSVIGSIEELVAGVEVETVSDTPPVEDVEPDVEPVQPVRPPREMAEVTPETRVAQVTPDTISPVAEPDPVRPEVAPEPVETRVEAAGIPVVEGVTTSDAVMAAEPVQTVPPEKVVPVAPAPEAVRPDAPVVTAAPVTPAEPVRPVAPAAPAQVAPVTEAKPVEIARIDPAPAAEPVEQVEQDPEVQQPVEDTLAAVTETPKIKPKPPAREPERKKPPEKKAKPRQNKGVAASSRKGGERVNSNSARSNANGRPDARTNDGGTRAASNYKGKVVAKLRRAKRYPREAKRRNLQGTARVSFTIARSGSVSGVRITRSSGHPELDQAAIDMVRRASPMPRFPADIRDSKMSLQVPVRFTR